MKTIVTHIGPDLDAITSVWILKTFFNQWREADVAFVPAGTTLNGQKPDENPEIVHVDTGFGKFDHHQTDEFTCAAKRVYEELELIKGEDPALSRLVFMVTVFDHFGEVAFEQPDHDRWDFLIVSIIDGLRLLYPDNPMKIISVGMDCLDGIYKTLQNKVWAEKELTVSGIRFQTQWGPGIAFETVNDSVITLAQKKGFVIVIRKDPNKQYLRIKSLPRDDIHLGQAFETLKRSEPDATWFLHASGHMILNGSSKNPNMKPSTRPLSDIIDVFRTDRE